MMSEKRFEEFLNWVAKQVFTSPKESPILFIEDQNEPDGFYGGEVGSEYSWDEIDARR